MQLLVGRGVRVKAWGVNLPELAGAEFAVHSVQSFGAGLHLWLRVWPGGPRWHLKVAQPNNVVIDEQGVCIQRAKYLQWQRKKLAKDPAQPALRLEISDR